MFDITCTEADISLVVLGHLWIRTLLGSIGQQTISLFFVCCFVDVFIWFLWFIIGLNMAYECLGMVSDMISDISRNFKG